MLRSSLDAVVDMNGTLARQVLAADEEVDSLHRELVADTRRRLREGATEVDDLLSLMVISKHIERVADLATNIAEDAIYTVDGEIVRHGRSSASGAG
jgi:phosphate transport system protein